jgi:hypothetical protein
MQLDLDSLLARLDFPRENTSLERGRAALETALLNRGLSPDALPFECHAHRADWAAAFLALAALAMLTTTLRGGPRARRAVWIAAGIAALLAVASLSGALDPLQSPSPEVSLQVVVEPVGTAQRELLLAAHYDSKTEPFDHVERSGLALGLAILLVVGILGALLPRRGSRLAASRATALVATLALGLGSFQLAGARWMKNRSHGIVDDAVATALLVDLAGDLHAAPPRTTRLRFLWFAAEEIGAQGSAAAAAALVPELASPRAVPAALPRVLVNLEAIGSGPELGFAGREWTGRGTAIPDSTLVAILGRALGARPRKLPFPVVTDAGPFARRGVPGITLLGLPRGYLPPRHLHGPHDRLTAIDVEGMQLARRTLERLVSEIDAP